MHLIPTFLCQCINEINVQNEKGNNLIFFSREDRRQQLSHEILLMKLHHHILLHYVRSGADAKVENINIENGSVEQIDIENG